MKRLQLVTIAIVAGVPALALTGLERLAATASAPAAVSSASGAIASPAASRAIRRAGRHTAAKRDVLEQLKAREAGTYIGEILLSRDSSLARWRERTQRPLKVWVQLAPQIYDWEDDFPAEVRSAFDDWMSTGIPVRFSFVTDSATADIHVTWIDQFDEPISGKTRWARDDNWWIVEGNITIAIHHHAGQALDHSAIKAISLHEVGHLLGLDHTSDASNIMTPRVRVRELSDADRATLRLLYSLPPGAVR
jgi:predicted Zn-dependent protease